MKKNFFKVLVFLALTFVSLTGFLAILDMSVKAHNLKVNKKKFVISADSANSGFSVIYIVDKTPETFWETGKTFPHWIRIGFKRRKKIVKYSLQTGPHGTDATGRMPKEWILQGSKNRLIWITLDSRKNEINWMPNEKRTYEFPNSTAYKYYRLYITAGVEPKILRLYEIELN
jgi:hypothetical protein